MDEAIRTLRLSNVCALLIDIEPNVPESNIIELLKELRQKKDNKAAQYVCLFLIPFLSVHPQFHFCCP